ncbi:Glycosyl transferase family 2 [Microbacterium sp. cf046]|uniref:glycosyltransferase n=1 Tax=Microbacterium sp. cf046 TaxID=1761803 RepID=UPI0008DFFB75|nr:glycosyltransferase [Microbacterium sp. cf046]SFR95705.1 Glycosyl transferase family 2 [Microbacterium sp. cf046]
MNAGAPVPFADVVIAAHDPQRAVGRAVASVLDGGGDDVRVTVVAHGIDPDLLAPELGVLSEDPRLRVVRFDDGVRSPAGPFNHGLGLATAVYVGVMGSDDFLEPGAMGEWIAHLRARGSDYLIAALRNQDGAVWRDPLTRRGRHGDLDLVRDRLAYRAAPLGLIRRDLLPPDRPALTPGLATGEDIEWGLELAALDGRIDVGVGLGAYVIGADAPQRITLEARSLDAELEALRLLARREWLHRLSSRRRRAIAIKLWRMNVVPAVIVRADAPWSPEALAALAEVTAWLEALAPRARRSLGRSERWIADAALQPTAASLDASVARARRAGTIDRVLTRNPLRALGTDAPLRRVLRLRTPA